MHFGLKIVFAKCAFYDLEFIMINKNDKKVVSQKAFFIIIIISPGHG